MNSGTRESRDITYILVRLQVQQRITINNIMSTHITIDIIDDKNKINRDEETTREEDPPSLDHWMALVDIIFSVWHYGTSTINQDIGTIGLFCTKKLAQTLTGIAIFSTFTIKGMQLIFTTRGEDPPYLLQSLDHIMTLVDIILWVWHHGTTADLAGERDKSNSIDNVV